MKVDRLYLVYCKYFKHFICFSVTGISGTFNSVNYPSNYFDNYEEHFIISVEAFSRILLYFDFYNLEYHVGCIYDYTEGRIYLYF